MDRETNPSAFPMTETDINYGQIGMSLRDYFAGQALAGRSTIERIPPNLLSKDCYQIADLMIEVRNAKE